MDDGKRLGACAERLGVAVFTSVAPSEERSDEGNSAGAIYINGEAKCLGVLFGGCVHVRVDVSLASFGFR